MSETAAFFLQHLADIERVVSSVCRRAGMTDDQVEEFSAEVKLRLVENDYGLLRKFKGRSGFPTYIAAVVKRMLLDYRSREWGKWHQSAEAQRLGEFAVMIERLLHRDGRTMDEAFGAITTAYPAVTRAEFETLASKLPQRVKRRLVDLEEAGQVAQRADNSLRDSMSATRISAIVGRMIDRMPEDDQLLLRLRFDSEMTVAQIARSLHSEQPALYRRLYRLFDELRRELTANGISHDEVEELIGADTSLLDFRFKQRGIQSASEETDTATATTEEETA